MRDGYARNGWVRHTVPAAGVRPEQDRAETEAVDHLDRLAVPRGDVHPGRVRAVRAHLAADDDPPVARPPWCQLDPKRPPSVGRHAPVAIVRPTAQAVDPDRTVRVGALPPEVAVLEQHV